MASKTLNERHHASSPEERDPENIQVCVRMRPLLEQYEDEAVWEIDYKTKTIYTKPDFKNSLDLNKLKSININHTRHYSELFHNQSFTFGNLILIPFHIIR
jgi:hypothetical protein